MIRDFAAAANPVLEQRARDWLAAPAAVAEPRPAATILLVRDAAGGPEVFVQRRVGTMAFAASTYVYPGGAVEPGDADPRLPWAGPSVQEWGRRLDTDPGTARGLVAAAVREAFEECGVLLAGERPGSGAVGAPAGSAGALREDLVGRRRTLTGVLAEHRLTLRSDLLRYKAHWVTPEFEPRRYDTRFLAAGVPQGQHPDGETTEADLVRWVRPQVLLDEAARGEALMLPPTVVTLEVLASHASVGSYLAEDPVVVRVLPELVRTDAGYVVRSELG
ncbi:MAG TPA: NUDIX hydrolase [Dermatophilaceae bacterium]|nr:NUDIX hydrolase [Dermatophilaceae bacterium]